MNALIQPSPVSLLEQLAEDRAFILARQDKVPCDIAGQPTSPLDLSTWMLPSDAAARANLLGLHVGMVLVPQYRRACIDIDSALQPDGTWSPVAIELCQRFPGAYIEVSLGGRGLHIFFSYTGDLPKHRTRWTPPGAANGLHLELYSQGHYMLTTGKQAIGDARTDHTAALHALVAERFSADIRSNHDDAEWTTEPAPAWSGPDDDAELIARAKRSRSANAAFGSGATFHQLWTGDPEKLQQAYPAQSPGQAWDYSAADLALANGLAFYTGGNCERTLKLMRESGLSRPKHDRPDYIRTTILKACASAAERGDYYNDGAKLPPSPAGDSRVSIKLEGGALEGNIATLQSLVADILYTQGDRLVRIGQAEQLAKGARTGETIEIGGIRRSLRQAICIAVTPEWLRLELMRRAIFWKYSKQERRWVHADCPDEIAPLILKQSSWSAFRPFKAISTVPVLRPTLSVWREPGYDAETGIFYQPTMDIPPIIDEPTRADAEAALARLREPFDEFPWASAASESVFLSHLITVVIRTSFSTAPVFIYNAPIAATGKTMLAQMPQLVATGNLAAVSPYSEREELRKVLFSSLLSGDSALLLDNIPNGSKVRSPELCRFVTSANYSDRVLGASQLRSLPNYCTVSLTGNNITAVSDLARRSEPCTLDVNKETARGRKFRIPDLKAYVLARRGQMIVDVLTVVRAYAFAGYPVTLTPLESFVEWSRLVRDPLVWLGLPDPVSVQALETDDEVGPLRAAFTAIAVATAAQEHRFTTQELVQLALNPLLAGGVKLLEPLEAAGCREPQQKLMYWLREYTNRIAAGWKLTSERDDVTNVTVWQMRAVGSGVG